MIGFRAETDVFQVLAACVLAIGFALCLCWISVFIGMIARTPGAVQGILFLALFPLTFGASTFVPVDTLPGWLQTFTDVNPMTHLVDSLRGLLLGGVEASDLLWTVGWMGALAGRLRPARAARLQPARMMRGGRWRRRGSGRGPARRRPRVPRSPRSSGTSSGLERSSAPRSTTQAPSCSAASSTRPARKDSATDDASHDGDDRHVGRRHRQFERARR